MPHVCVLGILLVALCSVVPRTEGHGRLREPPSRASMWREGFDNPINYGDNEVYCGGFGHHLKMGYKCGLCGDPFDQSPREHEAGGKYANGIITREYVANQVIDIHVELTAAHLGWMEFKLCSNNDIHKAITQECLDEHVLELVGHNSTKVQAPRIGWHDMYFKAQLPAGLTCTQCVLQWRYHAGNSWDEDEDGTGCLGCGEQEEFYGCSDVSIVLGDGSAPNVADSRDAAAATTTTTAGPRVATCTSGIIDDTRDATSTASTNTKPSDATFFLCFFLFAFLCASAYPFEESFM